jgi:hypothetical protein
VTPAGAAVNDLRADEEHFADADEEPRPASLWFYDHGVHVFPTYNKVPAVPKGTSQFDYCCTREQAARFKEFGVPLALFAVADSDSHKSEAWNAAHLPATPFMVTTGPYHDGAPGRGRHRWYRLVGGAPHFIHRGGHTIEFRHGAGQYVVGAGSIRPDGVIYAADRWSWNILDVPIFPAASFQWDDRPPAERGSPAEGGAPFECPAVVKAGERHDMLFRQIRSWRHLFDQAEAREAIHLINLGRCRPPLEENDAFERWFLRAWNMPDRPFTPALEGLSGLRGLQW